MNSNVPRQPSLFGDEPANQSSALIAPAAVNRPPTPAQRHFNRLIERIGRLRTSLAAWDAYIPRYLQRTVAELVPAEDAITSAQRRLVLQLDALLLNKAERMSRAHRRKAREVLLSLAGYLLTTGPDPEIEAAHDRHADLSHAEQQQFDVEFGEAVAAEIFGTDAVKGHEAKTMEEVLEHAGERFAEATREKHTARADDRSRGNRRQQAAQARAEAAREAATLTVREVYRRLARTLHPDREPDPTERERKTLLMQRANQAYEQNDLLTLLTLQLETEQIDAVTLATLPDERLRHYSRVLKEQSDALEAQIEERIVPFRVELDLGMGHITQQLVEQALSARIVRTGNMLRQFERALRDLADPKTRRAALEDLPDGSDAYDDFDESAAFAAMMMGETDDDAPPRKRAASKGHAGGKRTKKKRRSA